MAESRPAPALSARGRGVQKSHGWLGLAAIGKSPAPETPKTSDNRDRPLFAVRSAVARTTGQIARSYWGVENGLHWVLNAHHAAGRNDNSAYNLAILRHMALNLMQRGPLAGVATQQVQPRRLEGRVPGGAAFPPLKSGINAKCRLILIHFVTKPQ